MHQSRRRVITGTASIAAVAILVIVGTVLTVIARMIHRDNKGKP